MRRMVGIKRKSVCLIALFLLNCFPSYAQLSDTLRSALREKPKPFFKLDSRHSFIGNRYAGIFGFKAGLEYSGKLRFGVGFYWLTRRSDAFDEIITGPDNILYEGALNFNYLSILGEYLFYRRGKWEFGVPVQLGFGNAYYAYTTGTGKREKYGQGLIILYEPVIDGYYRPIPWLGIGVGGGFRIMLVNKSKVNNKFTSPIYVLKVVVFAGEVWKTFKFMQPAIQNSLQ